MHSVQSILAVDCLTEPPKMNEEGLGCLCLVDSCTLSGKRLNELHTLPNWRDFCGW